MKRFGTGWMFEPEALPSGLVAAARVVAGLAAELARSHPGADVVVGGRSVLVLPHAAATTPAPAQRLPRTHVLQVRYDGADLEALAASAQLTTQAVIERHAERDYTALLTGFLPGFAYLAEVDPQIAKPRLPQPRSAVPRFAVGIAGRLTGVYPAPSPGGWNLVGVAVDPPPLDAILPLDLVRFVPSAEPAPRDATSAPVWSPGSSPALQVKSVQGLASIQDRGRYGFRHRGMPWSGPLDAASLAAANAALGNAPDAAGIEVALGRLVLVALRELELSIDGGPPRRVQNGAEIRLDPAPKLTTYAAFRGGLDGSKRFGSRATLVVGQLAGRVLQRGDLLGLEVEETGSASASAAPPIPPVEPETVLELLQLVDDERLTPTASEVLLGSSYAVSSRMDRIGVRLEGPPVPRSQRGTDVALPDPVLPGCIQVTSDGTPVILGPDSAVTGGYPVLGLLTDAARARLGRLRPGARVRFRLA